MGLLLALNVVAQTSIRTIELQDGTTAIIPENAQIIVRAEVGKSFATVVIKNTAWRIKSFSGEFKLVLESDGTRAWTPGFTPAPSPNDMAAFIDRLPKWPEASNVTILVPQGRKLVLYTYDARQESQAPAPRELPSSNGDIRVIKTSNRCPAFVHVGSSAIIAMAPPGFNFGDSALTRRVVDDLLSKVPHSDECGEWKIALLVAQGTRVDGCFDGQKHFLPANFVGRRAGISCLTPPSAPHAFHSVERPKYDTYWNTITSPAEAIAQDNRDAARAAADQRLREEREAKRARDEMAAQAAHDSKIPVRGSGPFSAAQIKQACDHHIRAALIMGGGMKALNGVEYLPKLKGKDVSPVLPASADVIPTLLLITRYGESGQVRVKMFIIKDSFGDWKCSGA